MDGRTLGSTSITVSRIGLGLAALGRPGYINLGHGTDLANYYDPSAMDALTRDVLDNAWNSGVRYFDAARSYGRAEEFLSNWIGQRGHEKGAAIVGSKWGYTYTADWNVELPEGHQHEVKDHTLDVFNRQIKETIAQLNDHLSLYQVHSATMESGVFKDVQVLQALAKLRDQGVAVGFTVSGHRQAEAIRTGMELEVDGKRVFDTVQATWNLLEQSATKALEEAHAAGLGVIVKEALANGRLTDRNTDTGFANKMWALKKAAESLQTTVDALSLAVVLKQPWADVVLSGAASTSQLESNLGALKVAWSDSAASVLASFMRENPLDYWKRRQRLKWN